MNPVIYIEDYISKVQEAEILKLIPEKESLGQGRNQVLRFGSVHPYPSNLVSHKIPEIFRKLDIPGEFDSVTINEYFEGQMIDYHIDLHNSGNRIIILSLLGTAKFYLRNPQSLEVKHLELKPRSLTILENEYRWKWQHKAVAEDKRYSIVFRNSKEKINI